MLTSDCEEGNKKAMESIINDLQMNDADPCFPLINCLPDCVPVGKSIKCSFANWFILLNKERANLAILNTLPDDVNREIRSSLRKYLKLHDVLNKDRMDWASVIRLCSHEVLTVLSRVDYVVHTLVPEKMRRADDNKVGLYLHPVRLLMANMVNY